MCIRDRNAGNNYSISEIAPKKYQFTGVAGPEHGSSIGQRFRYDYIGCKFFYQNNWGGKISKNNRLTVVESSKALIKVIDEGNDDGNIVLADGVTLEEGATYVLTVDLTAGNDKGTVSLEKISDGDVYKRQGMDPEVNQWGNSGTVQGIDWGTYPHCRSYVFGINVEF